MAVGTTSGRVIEASLGVCVQPLHTRSRSVKVLRWSGSSKSFLPCVSRSVLCSPSTTADTLCHQISKKIEAHSNAGLLYSTQVSLDSGDSSVLIDGPAPALPTSNNNKADAAAANRSAVTASPKDANVFLTAAHDGYLRRWAADEHRLSAKLAVGAVAAGAAAPGIGAVEWTPKGSFVVCGLTTGDIVLVSPDGDMSVLSR